MDTSPVTPRRPVAPSSRSSSSIREAIALVASGGSPRVVVGGLSFGEALIEPARAMAEGAGVRIVPLWMPDDAGADIAVERIANA